MYIGNIQVGLYFGISHCQLILVSCQHNLLNGRHNLPQLKHITLRQNETVLGLQDHPQMLTTLFRLPTVAYSHPMPHFFLHVKQSLPVRILLSHILQFQLFSLQKPGTIRIEDSLGLGTIVVVEELMGTVMKREGSSDP